MANFRVFNNSPNELLVKIFGSDGTDTLIIRTDSQGRIEVMDGASFIEDNITGLSTNDTFTGALEQDTSDLMVYSYFVKNTGDNPIDIRLEVSPNGTDWFTDVAFRSVGAGKTDVFVPRAHMKYTRAAYRSTEEGKNSTLDIWFSGHQRSTYNGEEPALFDRQPVMNEPGGALRPINQVKTKIKHYESDFDLSKLPTGQPRDVLNYVTEIPSPLDIYQWFTDGPDTKIYMGGGTKDSDLVIITHEQANTRYRVRFGVAWSGHNRWAWDMKVPDGYQDGHAQLHWIKGKDAGAILAFNAQLDQDGIWQAKETSDPDNTVHFATYRIRGDGSYNWSDVSTIVIGADFKDYRRFLMMGSIDSFALYIDNEIVALERQTKPFSNDLVYAEFEAITNNNPSATPIEQFVGFCIMEAHDNVRVQSTRETNPVYTSDILRQFARSEHGDVDIDQTGTLDVVTIEVPIGKQMYWTGFEMSQTASQQTQWRLINETTGRVFGRWVFTGPDTMGFQYPTPQVVGIGRDIIKLQVIVTSPATSGTKALGVLHYAKV